MADLCNDIASFACELFSCFDADNDCFYSPSSISIALAMTLAGASGATANQIKAVVFKGAKDHAVIHEQFSKLLAVISEPHDGYKLHTANRLYLADSFNVAEDFMKSLKRLYLSTVQQVDFSKNVESTRAVINNWVSDVTNKKIENLIQPGVLTSLTRLVLVNAIYFKGNWKKQFHPKNTTTKPFHSAEGGTVDVSMMSQKGQFRYGENEELGCQVLGMPYVGDQLMFFALLPKEGKHLKDLEKKLTGVKLLQTVRKTFLEEVEVEIPKFKLEQSFSLGKHLAELGMRDAFSEEHADFSKISTEKPSLFVSEVIHKAFIEVNEEGSEAAAATAVVMLRCSLAMPNEKRIRFIANRPFLFLIADVRDETVIHFFGRLKCP